MDIYKFIKNHNEHKEGDEAKLDDGLGKYLEKVGVVIRVKIEKPEEQKSRSVAPKRKGK